MKKKILSKQNTSHYGTVLPDLPLVKIFYQFHQFIICRRTGKNVLALFEGHYHFALNKHLPQNRIQKISDVKVGTIH